MLANLINVVIKIKNWQIAFGKHIHKQKIRGVNEKNIGVTLFFTNCICFHN
jgi:hypothetical protein